MLNTQTPLKLIQDVSTRWNTVYYMMERLIEVRWPVVAVLSNPDVTKKSHAATLEMTTEQWNLMTEVSPLLKPFELATVLLSSEKGATSSCVFPVVIGIRERLENTGEEDDDALSNAAQNVRMGLLDNLISRFGLDQLDPPDETLMPLLIASFIDPRFRSLDFLTAEGRASVASAAKRTCLQHPAVIEEAEEQRDQPAEPEKKKSKTEEALGLLCRRQIHHGPQRSQDENIQREIAAFSAEPAIDVDADPLMWWKGNAERFPKLAHLARMFLSIPATSVPSERVFSKAGQVVNKFRSCLKPKNVDAILFLNKNKE